MVLGEGLVGTLITMDKAVWIGLAGAVLQEIKSLVEVVVQNWEVSADRKPKIKKSDLFINGNSNQNLGMMDKKVWAAFINTTGFQCQHTTNGLTYFFP